MSFLRLERAVGPDCPRCGCRDAEILVWPAPNERWFDRQKGGRARCNHCRLVFGFDAVPESPPEMPPDAFSGDDDAEDVLPESPAKPRDTAYPVRECPECGSPDVVLRSSGKKPEPGKPRVRYHVCRNCEERFKSIDSRGL